ncbi:MAG: Flp pilus assembly complex ATPase component TadA [Candidatus Omnitrophica bacterium]|nr:Flp pilus assembly complex ATPase component TadA [Candidatus Omnitrophota bacterium]
MTSLKERLAQLLVSKRLVTPEQLQEALGLQQQQGGSLQQLLVQRGFIKEPELLSLIGQELNVPLISLTRFKVDEQLKILIPRSIAKQYDVVPVSCIGKTLTVAMADPLNIFAIETIATMTGYAINPMLATLKDIREVIDLYYGTGMEDTINEMLLTSPSSGGVSSAPSAEADFEGDEALSFSQAQPVVRLTDAILTRAVHLRASDVLIEPMERAVRIRYRIDGLLQEVAGPPKPLEHALISRIKVMSELDIAEHRLPQDGHFTFSVDDRAIDVRVSVLPSSFGEKIVLRVLDRQQIMLDLSTMGFRSEDLETLKRCAERPHGMILATGPTGSGKTTTLYALLKYIDRPDKNLVTVEDPVEYHLEGINQVGVKAEIELTFAKALRAILRQDPDIILVGEIRDGETADMAVKAALTGHLVLSTLHTYSAVGTVVRLVNMGIEPFLINSCLAAVIGQRLVRRICPRCVQTYRPPKELAKRLGLVDERGEVLELAKGTGCAACAQSGYRGRQVIAEILVMTSEIRELIVQRSQERAIEEAAKAAGMRTLREDALDKVKQRLTTLDEVLRTTIGESVEAA